MSTAPIELVVADDGSIPASRLAELGVQPGAHLRVVESPRASFAGALADWGDLPFEDFARGSELAISDTSPTCAS